MRKYLFTVIVLVLISIYAFAQQKPDYQGYVRGIESTWDKDSEAKRFEEFKRQQDSMYLAFVREQEEAYRKYVEEVERKWNEFIGSTTKQWVEYSEDKSVRSIVNFEERESLVEEKPVEKPQGKPEPEKKPDVKPETGTEIKPETKPEVKPQEKPETAPETKVEKEAEVEVKTEVKPEAQVEKEPETKPEEKPAEKPQETPEVRPEEKPKAEVEKKPETKPEEKPEAKPEVVREVQIAEEPEIKPEEKPEVKPEAEKEAPIAEKPEAKPEKEPAAKPEEENKGQITVEAVVEADKPEAVSEAKKMIAAHIEKLFSPENEANKSILEGQVKTKTGEIVTPRSVKAFVQNEVLPKAKTEPKPIKSRDGVERVKVSVVIPMVPSHLEVRAKDYLRQARTYCRQYKEDLPLVMAVIQTESYFNPLAKSHIPAYGLMQIVPKYAGRDANKYVFKKDEDPKPRYLYDPENNLLLGIAYLHILRSKYFHGIEDPIKQEYLLVASYNGGMGAVIRKVLKRYNVPRMSQSEVYDALRKEMPNETKDYLAKVTTRKKNYLAWK